MAINFEEMFSALRSYNISKFKLLCGHIVKYIIKLFLCNILTNLKTHKEKRVRNNKIIFFNAKFILRKVHIQN